MDATPTNPTPPLRENVFAQKKVNHIFHYTKQIDFLIDILDRGFIPSYCLEQINDLSYYIPMVSFCNIPLADVKDYLRYGSFGIGLSLEWAIRNGISPVVYVHETTPFASLHKDINMKYLMRMLLEKAKDELGKIADPAQKERNFEPDKQLLIDINNITVPALQFFKGWKTQYDGREIITYLEREWRYVPQKLTDDRIVPAEDQAKVGPIQARSKPHFPDFALAIKELSDLRYIIVESHDQRRHVFDRLAGRFSHDAVINALIEGQLHLLTLDQVRNDF